MKIHITVKLKKKLFIFFLELILFITNQLSNEQQSDQRPVLIAIDIYARIVRMEPDDREPASEKFTTWFSYFI